MSGNGDSELAESFEWLPHRVDVASQRARFIRLTRDDHRAATFLDDEYVGEGRGIRTEALAAVAARVPRAPAPIHFIFHSAFCCSTLLARAVDIEGRAMGLKEPMALADLANAAIAGADPARVRSALEIVLRLLARPFGPGEAVVVKPSNAANPLIEDMLALAPNARALLLYSPLPDWLRSVAKKGLFGRIWVRRLLASLERRPQLETGFTDAQRWEQSDLQVAALAWLHEQARFARLLRADTRGRLASLDSVALLADRSGAMDALLRLFGIDLPPAELAAIVDGPVFARDSKKHDRPLDAEQRRQEQAAAEAAYGEEIAMVLRWAEAVAAHAGVPMALPRPLVARQG